MDGWVQGWIKFSSIVWRIYCNCTWEIHQMYNWNVPCWCHINWDKDTGLIHKNNEAVVVNGNFSVTLLPLEVPHYSGVWGQCKLARTNTCQKFSHAQQSLLSGLVRGTTKDRVKCERFRTSSPVQYLPITIFAHKNGTLWCGITIYLQSSVSYHKEPGQIWKNLWAPVLTSLYIIVMAKGKGFTSLQTFNKVRWRSVCSRHSHLTVIIHHGTSKVLADLWAISSFNKGINIRPLSALSYRLLC